MRSLRTLLVRGPVLGFGLVLALLVAASTLWLQRLAWQEAEAKVETSLDHVSRQLDFRLAEMERLAEAMGGAWELGHFDPADAEKTWLWLGDWVRPHPHLTGVNLVRADGRGFGLGKAGDLWGGRSLYFKDGRWWFSAAVGDAPRVEPSLRTPGQPGLDFRDRPWYRRGLEVDRPTWTEVFRFAGRRAGQPGIFLVRPVRDAGGQLLGVLSLDLLLESLAQVVEMVRPTPGTWLMVLDAEGRIVVPPAGTAPADASAMLLQPVGPDRYPALEALFQRAKAGSQDLQLAHHRYHHRIRRLGRTGGPDWYLVVALPEADVDAHPRRRALGVAGLGLALLAGFGFLAHHFARRVAKPLTRLAKGAESLARGEAPDLPASRIREIQQLANALADAHRGLGEREVLHERLRKGQRLEAVGTLAGGIAHDLNNHLAAILTHLELGIDKLGGAHPAWENLKRAWDATRRCAETTRAILSFSRPAPPEFAPLDLHRLVEGTLALVSKLLGPGIQVELDLQAAHTTVQGDRTQLEQLLVNLLLNARDALPAGGRIQVWTDSPGEQVRLMVRDNGTGMMPDVLERIFEPFFSTKGIGKGTGLGLATALKVAETHGGRLEVVSEWGQGACFTLSLPRTRGSEARHDSGDVRAYPALAGYEVLVADDEEALRSGIAEALEACNAKVRLAADGEQAWALWQDRPADLLVTDQLMPGCTGTELLARLRAAGSTAPVLILSGRGLEGLEEELAQDPRVDHLSKPFTLARLLSTAARLLKTKGG